MFQANNELKQKINDIRNARWKIKSKLKTRSLKLEARNITYEDTPVLVKKYYKLTDKLYELGYTVPSNSDYLMPGYWNIPVDELNLQSNKLKNTLIRANVSKPVVTESNINIFPTPSETPLKKINIPSEQSYYIFNLAWTDIDIPEQKKMIDSLLNYFNLIEMTELEKNNFKYGDNKEHIIKYKKKCSAELKNLIIKSMQFIIDSFGNQRVQQNTSVYANKK